MSSTFLQQLQKLISFYNEGGEIILKTGTVIPLGGGRTFAENNTWE